VYSVSEENDSVTVTLSDARDPYVKFWAYFKTVYRFIFDTESVEYVVYASMQGEGWRDWRRTGLEKLQISKSVNS